MEDNRIRDWQQQELALMKMTFADYNRIKAW